MATSDLITWLREHTPLTVLTSEVLEAIALHMKLITVEGEQTLVKGGTAPERLYILKSGQIQSQGTPEASLLTGTLINLRALILEQPVSRTLVTLNRCELWCIDAEDFKSLLQQYPEITQAFSQQLALELKELSSELSFQQERQTILRPYLVTKVKRGVIGKSRYAIKLRSQIKNFSDNRQPVLIFGEPGLQKDNLATLLHFSSPFRREPIIQINCSQLQASGAELFGRVGGKLSLLEALGKGTLILNNLQELSPELFKPIAQLLKDGTYYPVSRSENTPSSAKTSQCRIIVISEKKLSNIDGLIENIIKVPPLRVRKKDIEDLVTYYISLMCRRRGTAKVSITPEAIRKLQAYDFPNNLRELENLIERALVQLEGYQEITEEIIWPSQSKKQQFRFNLLKGYPRLRQFFRSPWYPDRLNYGFTVIAFALINIILWIGPQTRAENFALNLFWAWWWPLVLIGFLFVGRLWCAVCPFMIYGELTQKVSLWLFPRKLKKWPRHEAETWGGWFLWGLFAVILLWEELWDLKNTAYLSSCLLLLITAGAMICSTIFERRFWCRYLCPIGGMNGMFAKLSMTELRGQQGTCSAQCTTYQCYKGGPQKGEGLETNGCPLYSHPAQLEDNRDCVLCMTCLKACPHRSVEFNLRPPGIELWTTHVPRSYEVALLLLLLDAVFLHRLPQVQAQLGFSWDLNQFWIHSGLAVLVLSLPALLPLVFHQIMGFLGGFQSTVKIRPFKELAYGYLPLVLAGNLAYYLPLGLGEAGQILPITLATFGFSVQGVPVMVAHPAVITFLQETLLIFGVVLSIILTQKIAKLPFQYLMVQHISTSILAIGLWNILL
ncbi:nitrogen assimilation regulatory protein [Crocosphaera subtropica ATCC 51142]|uniref:Nitrogen assimilation regulatory protein n=1 Tax=Crocosphaera subtropica (strain ATCC 51142 / BH68) TaxID=43989 RepID=B1WXA4_CROS5|nr:sigma 54-interacting transcriptional regulator [Crocosphaera subtropica]ACB50848.1 nitrogen assimilation regulatory protein [Crocosphaera subtropica ATCC 51142]